ncbi:hypothetical protein GCM10027169_24250 [Gordonia jinhuaensis]
MVVGQRQTLGPVGQRPHPVVELCARAITRGLRGTEHLTLPERVVGIGDIWGKIRGNVRVRQIRLSRRRHRCVVRGEQIRGQRRQRLTVGGDVVDHHHQDMLIDGLTQQPKSHGWRDAHIEWGAYGLVQCRLERICPGGGPRCEVDVGEGITDGQDLLIGPLVAFWIARAQGFVPGEYRGQSRAQGVEVQRALQAQSVGDVLGGGGGIGLCEQPHPLLRKRQQDRVGSVRVRDELGQSVAVTCGLIGRCVDRLGELRDRRGVEQRPQRDRCAGGLPNAGHCGGGEQ